MADEDLVENVAPIQLGIRLLIPAGSRLLDLADLRSSIGPFDPAALVYPWKHSDPRLDVLAGRVQTLAHAGDRLKRSRSETFTLIWRAATGLAAADAGLHPIAKGLGRKVPHFTEPWYCCAEPTEDQFVSIASHGEKVHSDTFF
jgi:hypothetical protein